MVGNDNFNISKDENLTHLLDSFHRDKPKGRRGMPTWNLSLVLHRLTKAPFEPMRKVSLKHLTFKTVFLLALGSGKRRSEIHAWLYKNIRHQENWGKVSLYPSPVFLSKNQLAREGPCVAPVIIPALAPTLDNSLQEDKTLYPVRALRYYLDRTKDLRKGKDLVFVSFRKSFHKDIVPATISSWIKQTVLLCYQLSDEEAQNLHQARARDVRAFAASLIRNVGKGSNKHDFVGDVLIILSTASSETCLKTKNYEVVKFIYLTIAVNRNSTIKFIYNNQF